MGLKFSNIIILFTCLLVSVTVRSETLTLPTKLPALNMTAEKALGTLAEGTGLKVGTKISNFKSHDHLGKPISFEQLKNQAPLMIVFYRGGWCPYCNLQIRQLTNAWSEFQKRNVTPVLISADKPDGAALAANTYEIPFPVLADPNLTVHDLFNVTMKVDDKLIPKYKEYGIDLEAWSGKTTTISLCLQFS
ncbi:MAG: peroxiredoxin family protein [Pseudomonadales bacterium]|nr:peroxiredoxin family protein [Pseudomonadales bacterium]